VGSFELKPQYHQKKGLKLLLGIFSKMLLILIIRKQEELKAYSNDFYQNYFALPLFLANIEKKSKHI
jgi:hypothetical protein